jgi:hypothetical protein
MLFIAALQLGPFRPADVFQVQSIQTYHVMFLSCQ